MKKILISGKGSYIGTSFECYMSQFSEEYSVDVLDMLDPDWHKKDFSPYDVVFHVSGIAHHKETNENAHLYYEINRDLTLKVANKAKADGVSQFVFLSSMSVYGKERGNITKDTTPNPKSHYGKSKLEAEALLQALECENFKVALVRPPMIYGKNCKGNFQTVVKIVKKSPVFPKVKNERSMIYIDTLCDYVKGYIDDGVSGVLFPQNAEYMNTSEMACAIAEKLGKRIYLSIVLGLFVRILCPFVSVANKAFGSLVYEKAENVKATNKKTNYETVLESV